MRSEYQNQLQRVAWLFTPRLSRQSRLKGQKMALTGTNGNDLLSGTSGNDIVEARQGDDAVATTI
jgi:Ca2+-binding RTX toxin-like protein